MEKLTVNVNAVDLGLIELLVEQGFYSNRAEFIRVAIHDQLEKHGEVIRAATARLPFLIGALSYNRQHLERMKASRAPLQLRIIGYLSIAEDVDVELARAAISSIKVHGIFKASKAVKAALGDRIAR